MINEVNTSLRGKLRHHEPLARYTTWRIGGPAKVLYLPADLADLANFLHALPASEPLVWLGLGSNTLIRDQGIQGTVIVTQNCLNGLTQESELTVRAEAGVSCAKVARFCARLGLVGAEFLAGIPGTIGGALAMNAGAYGAETWDFVEQVETINRQGQVFVRTPVDYQVAYRYVSGPPQEWFVAGSFKLQQGDKEQSLERIRSLLAKRAETQPTSEYNCGSVFRNPPGDYAARLIEACGLKGYTHGGASVSTKHANFIINNGTATAADIEALIAYVAQRVKERFDIDLVREVHILGE